MVYIQFPKEYKRENGADWEGAFTVKYTPDLMYLYPIVKSPYVWYHVIDLKSEREEKAARKECERLGIKLA